MRDCRQSMSDQMYCRVWAATIPMPRNQENAARQCRDDTHDRSTLARAPRSNATRTSLVPSPRPNDWAGRAQQTTPPSSIASVGLSRRSSGSIRRARLHTKRTSSLHRHAEGHTAVAQHEDQDHPNYQQCQGSNDDALHSFHFIERSHHRRMTSEKQTAVAGLFSQPVIPHRSTRTAWPTGLDRPFRTSVGRPLPRSFGYHQGVSPR